MNTAERQAPKLLGRLAAESPENNFQGTSVNLGEASLCLCVCVRRAIRRIIICGVCFGMTLDAKGKFST